MMEVERIADAVFSSVKGYVDRAVSRIEGRLDEIKSGKDGAPGEPGKDGKDGAPGEKGDTGPPGEVDMDAVQAQVDEFLKSVPIPQDGKDGEDGKPGEPGEPGKDGKSLTLDDIRPLVETELTKMALEFERRAQDKLERAIANIPKPADGKDGKDGQDGMGFDDIEVKHDGERRFKFILTRGERVKEFEFKVPLVIDRGVYDPKAKYEKGDGVSWGGAFWIAQVDAPEGKPGDSKDWRLAVKKGRDGKEGPPGPPAVDKVKK